MNKILLVFLGAFFASMSVQAATDWVSAEVKGAWMSNTDSWNACGLDAPLPGVLNDACSGGASCKKKGDVYWIAWELNSNGGRFCPTQVGAARSGGGKPYTTYYNVANNTDCVWLCKNGKGGDKCSSDEAEVSGVAQIMQSTGANTDDVNRENDIAGFMVVNAYKDCSAKAHKPFHSNKEQEHDVVLAIGQYTADGYGAWVQPLVVRAASGRTANGTDGIDSRNNGYAFAYLANNSDKTLVCMNGYRHNSNGDGCVKFTAAQAARDAAEAAYNEAANGACVGWTFGATEEFLANYKIVSVDGCNQYRCKNSSMGFSTSSDRTCVPCDVDAQHGITAEGVCIVCPDVKKFSDKAADTGYCVDRSVLTTQDLLHGYGQTGQNDYKEACWYKLYEEGIDKYKTCVVGSLGQ